MISSCPNMVLYQKRQTIKFKLWVDWLGLAMKKNQMMHPIYLYSPEGTALQS